MLETFLSIYLSSFGADLCSTHYALNRGARELWFPSQNLLVIDITSGVAATGVSLAAVEFNKKHPKWTALILGSLATVHIVGAVRNYKIGRSLGTHTSNR